MRKGWLASAAMALALACSGAAGAPADELRGLLERGRAADAYALGKKHPEELGKPDFDFYFGVAAIDSGHAGEGLLALERYVILHPDNDRARLELARGYFVLGELVRAREEFENVARRNPPPNVQATIDRFLDSIRARETRFSTTATGYVEIGGGHDSNVNSGVGNSIISIPTLGQVRLAASGVRSGSGFFHLGAGGQLSHPVAPGLALLAGGSVEGKMHANDFDKQFDQTSVNGYGGVSYIKDKDLYRATVSLGSLYVDYNRFRDTLSAGAEWHRQLDEFNTGSVFAQYARLEYPQSALRNADFYAGGVGWRRAFIVPMQPIVLLQALLGQERNDASPVRNDLSRELLTLRGGLSLTPAPRWGASAALSYTKSRFKDRDALFATRRNDDFHGFELGGSYRVTRRLTLRADYQRANNQSNIALNRYKRDLVTFRARYDF